MSDRSQCPACGTILRVRDRSFVGRKVNCPECKISLCVESIDIDSPIVFRQVVAADVSTVAQKKTDVSRKSARSNPRIVVQRSFVRRTIESPFVATCLVLIAVLLLLAVLVLKPRFRLFANPVLQESTPSGRSNDSLPQTTDDSRHGQSEFITRSESVVVPMVVDVEFRPVSALIPENAGELLFFSPVKNQTEVDEGVMETTLEISDKPAMRIDVESKLAQEILLYKQPSVSRRFMIEALEEQSGVSIRYNEDELGLECLEEKTSFELKNTTLKSVIEKVAQMAGWVVEIDDVGVRLVNKK